MHSFFSIHLYWIYDKVRSWFITQRLSVIVKVKGRIFVSNLIRLLVYWKVSAVLAPEFIHSPDSVSGFNQTIKWGEQYAASEVLKRVVISVLPQISTSFSETMKLVIIQRPNHSIIMKRKYYFITVFEPNEMGSTSPYCMQQRSQSSWGPANGSKLS